MQSDRWDFQLAAADTHFATARTTVRMLFDILLIHLALETACLRRTQSTQVERVRQVELGHWMYLALYYSTTHLVEIRVCSTTHISSHCGIEHIDLVILNGCEVTSRCQRAELSHWRADTRSTPLNSHEGTISIQH